MLAETVLLTILLQRLRRLVPLHLAHLSQMLLVPSLLAMKTTRVIITMVSKAMVGAIIMVSVIVVTLIEAAAMAMKVSEVAMGRRNPLTMILTSTVNTVKEWVMIFMSAESMLPSKK